MLIDKTEILKSEEEKIVPVPAPEGKPGNGAARKDTAKEISEKAAAKEAPAKAAVSKKAAAAGRQTAGKA